MELIWLEDFAALAETGNFSRAAEQRHVSQPAFSRRIKALEDWVGTPLFDRTSHGVGLTGAGTLFRPDAEEIIRRFRKAREAARQAGGKEAAMLRFVATHSLSFTFFPRWIVTLEAEAALGPIHLVSESMLGCEQVMQQGRAQFLLCYAHAGVQSSFDPAQFRSALIGRDSLVAVTAPKPDGGPLWQLDSFSPEPIPYLAYNEASGLGRILEAQPEIQASAGKFQTVFTSHLAAVLLSMARSGQGLAWLPLSLAEPEMRARSVMRAGSAEHWDVPVEVRLIRPKARQSKAAEALWALITKRQNTSAA